MAAIIPFRCIRPGIEAASLVAALPYDVYTRQEAKEEVQRNAYSFLAADRAETQLDDDISPDDPRVYQKAKQTLDKWLKEGIYQQDNDECYYIYALTMGEHRQIGIVGCASVDDYLDGTIHRHENTRREKEQDRFCHIETTNTHTGLIFLTYHADEELNRAAALACTDAPLYDFISDDGIRHEIWKVGKDAQNAKIRDRFAHIRSLYIADGHHRAAAAVRAALERRSSSPGWTGRESYNFFPSVLFPDDQLQILPYNRVVSDLNAYSREEFMERLKPVFDIEKRSVPCRPKMRHHIGLCLGGEWYELAVKEGQYSHDPVGSLDVSILQNKLLGPILGIKDPRTDSRIQFVGGVRGLGELERLVDGKAAAAFSMYPTSIGEFFAVADAGLLMPPKSTWFEPKPRSGLFLHKLS